MPSPHTVQSARQRLPFAPAGEFGGSQVSLGSTMPSTHCGAVQSLWQPSVSTVLPSSHSSPPCTTPSPQTVQLARQGLPCAPAGEPGGSQVSGGITLPSPHDGKVQSLWQPSVSTAFPSSHSSPICWTPSPQTVQLLRQG